MGAALLAQTYRTALQHQALGYRHRTQVLQLGLSHHAGVHVRQQAGLIQHRLRRCPQVGQGRSMAKSFQFIPGHLVTQFRLVPQGEQGFVAPRLRAGPGYVQHLLDTEIGPLPPPRRLREGAVVAHIAAQLRQWDKNLGRVGNDTAVSLIAQCRRARHQLPYIKTGP